MLSNRRVRLAYHGVQVQCRLLQLLLRRSRHERRLCERLAHTPAPFILPLFLRHADAAVQSRCNAVQLGWESACRSFQQGKLFYEGLPCFWKEQKKKAQSKSKTTVNPWRIISLWILFLARLGGRNAVCILTHYSHLPPEFRLWSFPVCLCAVRRTESICNSVLMSTVSYVFFPLMFLVRLRSRASSTQLVETSLWLHFVTHYARLFVFVPHKTGDNKCIVRLSVCCFVGVCRSHILVKLSLGYTMS